MTISEFSDGFSTLLNSYGNRQQFGETGEHQNVVCDEYEKSVFLTLAQNEFVAGLYTGRNYYGGSFENSEEMRRYLDTLVKDCVPEASSSHPASLDSNSVYYDLPEDLAYIVYEQITLNTDKDDCANGTVVSVQPMTHDEYHKIRKNPFRGVSKRRAIRLDSGERQVEIIYPYGFKDYRIRYLAIPEPIILEDLTGTGLSLGNGKTAAATCVLPEMMHKPILERAVQLALVSKGIKFNS